MPDDVAKPAQQSGGGGQPPKRPQRKPLFDGSNLMGAALWLFSALLTSIALMLVFINIPAPCLGERGQFVGCFREIATSVEGISVLSGALFIQMLISLMVNRLRSPIIVRVGNVLEWLINFIGLYWLVCIQIGAAPGVYAIISPLVQNFTVPTLLWFTALIIGSIGLDIIVTNSFNAPPAQSGVQRR